MARSGGDEDYEQITRANGVLNNRPLLSVWTSRLQALSLSHSQTVQHTEQPPDSDSDLSFAESFDDAGGESPVTLTDLDMLDCLICVQPLCSPIYQVITVLKPFKIKRCLNSRAVELLLHFNYKIRGNRVLFHYFQLQCE